MWVSRLHRRQRYNGVSGGTELMASHNVTANSMLPYMAARRRPNVACRWGMNG